MVDPNSPFADPDGPSGEPSSSQHAGSNAAAQSPSDPFIAPPVRRASLTSSNSDHELRLELDAFQSDHEDAQEGSDEEARLMPSGSTSEAAQRPSSSMHASRQLGASSTSSRRSKRSRRDPPGMVNSLYRFARRMASKAAKETEQVNLSRSTYRDASASTSGLIGASASRLGKSTALKGLSPGERALWEWANVQDIDGFLQEVYSYYVGKGIVCIVLSRALSLLTGAFVIGFSIFLLGCIDYSAFRHDGQLSDVVVGHCVSHFSLGTSLFLLLVFATYGWQLIRFGLGISRLLALNRFYVHLLSIPETDIQAIPWHAIVTRISDLQAAHPIPSLRATSAAQGSGPGGAKLDAHDVANRLMRSDNYLIALFNKDVLHLGAPISLPFLGSGERNAEGKGNMTLTRALEWNITFCLMGYLLDERGQVRKPFVSDRHRADLIEGLKRRFLFMAIVNAILAPFIFVYLLMFSFFRYFEEYHKDPSNLGSRQYTQYAKWKLREFNELPHLFRRRCHASYAPAGEYVNQFPKERVALLARFTAFISGSFMSVLLLASLVSPDLFLHFELSPGRNVLFYIGIFGTILAVSRGMIPDERGDRKDPEDLMRHVVECTHYLPDEWKGKLHSAEVHKEFSKLYSLKLLIFLTELLSVLVTPLILYRTLPTCAEGIIDFFREFTVHVDGLGYLCSFAVFDFERNGNVRPANEAQGAPDAAVSGARGAARDKRLTSRQNKMELSLLNFKAAHPDWHPSDPSSSRFLERVTDAAVAATAAMSASDARKLALKRDGLTRPFSPTTSRFLPPGAGAGKAQRAPQSLAAVDEGRGRGSGDTINAADGGKGGSPAALHAGADEPFVDGRVDGVAEDSVTRDIWRDDEEGDGLGGTAGSPRSGDVRDEGMRGIFREVYEGNAGTRAGAAGRAW